MSHTVLEIAKGWGLSPEGTYNICWQEARPHLTPHFRRKAERLLFVSADGTPITVAGDIYDSVGEMLMDMTLEEAGLYLATSIDAHTRSRGIGKLSNTLDKFNPIRVEATA